MGGLGRVPAGWDRGGGATVERLSGEVGSGVDRQLGPLACCVVASSALSK